RGEMLAMEAATGRVQWRQRLPTAARSAPTVAEGRLFVATLDNQILALSADDGKRVWSHQAPAAETTVLGLPAPAYADGIVVAGFGSGDLLALRAASGGVAWSDSLASARGRTSIVDLSAIRGMPVIKGGVVYGIGLGRLMLAVDMRSGRRLWEREVASSETPWVAGDWIFIMDTDNQMGAINRNDGGLAWVSQLGRFENEEKQRNPITWVGPVLAGDRLVVAGSTGVAQFVNPVTGKVLGEQKLSSAIAVAPIVADGTLYAVTDDGTLTAYR
ncbi:MAG TPA: PQQ-binding-like beta-propeller repeat protein, partial [Phenylobacterium sp.]